MRISRIKIRRVGSGEDATAWSRILASGNWLDNSRTLKQDGASWVRRAVLPGSNRSVVIKCRPATGLSERLKAWTRASRGDRHWYGAQWLLDNGFATAQPLVLAHALVDGVRSELLVTEHIDARSLLEHMAAHDLSPREEHAVARALAAMVTRMMEKGRYNRDAKPSNLLLAREPDASPRIVTIDTVAIRRGDGKSRHTVAPLILEAIGTGCEPRRALKARFIHELVRQTLARHALDNASGTARRAAVRLAWRIVEDDVRRHGDPRPRVNPLDAPAHEKARAP